MTIQRQMTRKGLIRRKTNQSTNKQYATIPPLNWFGLVSLFNGISNFVGYLMPKPFSEKNSSTI